MQKNCIRVNIVIKIVLFNIVLFSILLVNGQTIDWHNHITNKHFISDKVMPDSVTFYLKRDRKLPLHYLKNWDTLRNDIKHKDDSHYENYFQSTYTDLQKGNIKIAVQAISPLEIDVFHDRKKWFRNYVTRTGYRRSHMPKERFLSLIKTPSWKEAYSEYLYTVNQDIYSHSGDYKMIFPENSDSLKKHINDENTSLGIISFEGGHILFGDTVFKEKGFMDSALSENSKNEVRRNIMFLKNSDSFPHRTFFYYPYTYLLERTGWAC